MRRAKSLVSVHLSNNPGTTERVVSFVTDLVRAKDQLKPAHTFKVKKCVYNVQEEFEEIKR